MPSDPFRSGRAADTLRHFQSRIPGPLGCLLVVLALPFVLFGLLVASLFVRRKVARVQEQLRRAPTTPEEMERETAVCSLVRSLSVDASFTREEALSAPVIVTGGAAPPAAELLAEAERRGWVSGPADRMTVTDRGRAEASRFLDQHRV